MSGTTWTDERIALLKELWAQGLSQSQCAAALNKLPGGHVTRGAISGKVDRLGLQGRAVRNAVTREKRRRQATPWRKTGSQASEPTPARPAAKVFAVEPFVPSAEELVIPLAERKTIQTLVECSCRWPIGDPQHPDFHFCGKTKVPGLPYCEHHARRAYQPPDAKRRDRAIGKYVPVKVEKEIA